MLFKFLFIFPATSLTDLKLAALPHSVFLTLGKVPVPSLGTGGREASSTAFYHAGRQSGDALSPAGPVDSRVCLAEAPRALLEGLSATTCHTVTWMFFLICPAGHRGPFGGSLYCRIESIVPSAPEARHGSPGCLCQLVPGPPSACRAPVPPAACPPCGHALSSAVNLCRPLPCSPPRHTSPPCWSSFPRPAFLHACQDFSSVLFT